MSGNFDSPFCTFDPDHVGKYSLIHIRSVVQSVRDVRRFLEQCRDSLGAGGRIEMHEFGRLTADDGSLAGTAIEEVLRREREAAAGPGPGPGSGVGVGSGGRLPGDDPLPGLGRLLEDVGFVDVVVARSRCPVNPGTVAPGWADGELDGRDQKEREVARLYRRQFDDGRLLDAQCKSGLMNGLGWSEERVDALIGRVRRELRDPEIRAYSPAYVCRFPLSPSFLFFFCSSHPPFTTTT